LKSVRQLKAPTHHFDPSIAVLVEVNNRLERSRRNIRFRLTINFVQPNLDAEGFGNRLLVRKAVVASAHPLSLAQPSGAPLAAFLPKTAGDQQFIKLLYPRRLCPYCPNIGAKPV